MLARRSLQHVCFMCAHLGRQFTNHTVPRAATAVATRRTQSPSFVAAEDGRSADGVSIFLDAAPEGTNETQSAQNAEGPSRPKSKRRGKKKSKTVESRPDIPPTPREPGPSEMFLASLQETSQEPTLSDLEHFKPDSEPLNFREYEAAWKSAVQAICKSFNTDQLRAMVLEVAGDVPVPPRKEQRATLVLERSWGWRNPVDLAKEEKMRVKLQARTYTCEPSELFLLLGRSGSDLLHLSVNLHVRVSVLPSTDALSIRVEGRQEALNNMDIHMRTLKASIETEVMNDPTQGGLPHDLIQRISRLSGAFIEHTGDGKLRISAKKEHDLTSAKRLVVRATAIDVRESAIPSVFHQQPAGVGTGEARYALFPFFSPRTFLWTMGAGGAFRARKVSEWISADDDFDERFSLLAGNIVNTSDQAVDLRAALLRVMPLLTAGRMRRISASLGNILFTSRTSTAQRASLASPLEQPIGFQGLLRWVSNNSAHYKSTFVPDLPIALLSASPAPSIPLNRLIYRAPDSLFGIQAETFRTIEMDLVIPELDPHALDEQIVPTMDLEQVECRIGVENAVDVLLPDRPMDARFSVFDYEMRALQDSPKELIDYANALQAFFTDSTVNQPSVPLHVIHTGYTYTLDTSASVRRSVEQFLPPPAFTWDMNKPTRAITESNLDQEGNQRATTCEIHCEDVDTLNGWNEFIRHCDRLTMRLPRPVPSLEQSIQDLDSLPDPQL